MTDTPAQPAESPVEPSGAPVPLAEPGSAAVVDPGPVADPSPPLLPAEFAVIRDRARRRSELRADPQPGLSTWNTALTRVTNLCADDVPALLAEVDRLGAEVEHGRQWTRDAGLELDQSRDLLPQVGALYRTRAALNAAQPVLAAAEAWRDSSLGAVPHNVWKAVTGLKAAVDAWRADPARELADDGMDELPVMEQLSELRHELDVANEYVALVERQRDEAQAELDAVENAEAARVATATTVTRAELGETLAENAMLRAQVHTANDRIRGLLAELDRVRKARTAFDAVMAEDRDFARQCADMPNATLTEAIEGLRAMRDAARADHGRLFAELGAVGAVMRAARPLVAAALNSPAFRTPLWQAFIDAYQAWQAGKPATAEQFTAPKSGWYRFDGPIPGTGWRPEYAAAIRNTDHGDIIAISTQRVADTFNTPGPTIGEPEPGEASLFQRVLIDQVEHPEDWPTHGIIDPPGTITHSYKGWDWVNAGLSGHDIDPATGLGHTAETWRTEAENNAAAYVTMVTQHDMKARTRDALGHQYLDALGRLQAVHDMVTITFPHLHTHADPGHIVKALQQIHHLAAGQERDDGTIREIVAQWRQLNADEPAHDLEHDWRHARQWLTQLATQHGWNIR